LNIRVAVAVHLNRAPHSARLVAWGRSADGWWGCVTWRQRLRGATGICELDFAAWVPADAISRPNWSTTSEPIPRLELPGDPRAWPAPPGWPAWYAGVWRDGPVTVPADLQVITGPAWRERRRR
jgi:hypothetical protein